MPAINYTAWWFWLNVAQIIATMGIGVYVWWVNREKVTAGKFLRLEKQVGERITRGELDEFRADNKDRLDRHRSEMIETQNRLIKIESDIYHLPDQQDLKNLADRIGSLDSSLHEFSGRLQGINRAVDLINEFLIKQGLSHD